MGCVSCFLASPFSVQSIILQTGLITLYNVCSVHRGGGGGTMSTSGDVQYIRGISWLHRGDTMSTPGGNYEYIGGCSIHGGVQISPPPPMYSWYPLMYRTAPMYWTSPDVLNIHYTECNCLIVCHFWAKSGKYYFDKHQWEINAVMKRKSSNCVGILSDQGKLQLHQTSENILWWAISKFWANGS